MNKDEILSKAQKELSPVLGDEREQQIELQSIRFSSEAYNVIFVILYFLTWMWGDTCFELYYPVLFMKAAQISYKAWKLRKRFDIFAAIIMDICILALTNALLYPVYTNYMLGR